MKKTLALLLVLVLAAGALSVNILAYASADKEPYTFTMYSNITSELTEEDMKVINAIADSQNVTVDVQIAPSSNYAESMQLTLASGVYPDLALFSSTTDMMYVDACRDGVIIPLNSYLESGDYPDIMNYTYPISWEVLDVLGTGEIFSIPRTSIARCDCYMIRKDWLDALGYEYDDTKPVTLEWITQVMNDFTFGDPDGNGIDDTYGLSAASADGNLTIPTAAVQAYGLTGWREYDGEYMNLQYSTTNDAFKKALAWTAEQYAKGTIDPDWPTLDTTSSRDRFTQGITGIRGEFVGWMSDNETNCRLVNDNARLSYIVYVVDHEGQATEGGSYSTGYWGAWSIFQTAEHPERIMDFLNAMLSDDWWTSVKYGIEGDRWEYNADGNIVATEEFGNISYSAPRAMLRRNNDPGFFISLDLPLEQRLHVEELLGICIEQAVFPLDNNFRPSVSDDMQFIDYQTYMAVQISKIITGERPVDDWDEILEGWYAAGGDSYVAEMQAYIAENQSK
ncbi:MAG: extracellular solute-binding protein [Clostridia bacterium]|nr:extracellular solute-binding protein [Clostridia bacterium]